MLIEFLITSLLLIFAIALCMFRTPKLSKIYFVGPHSTGKTEALLKIAGSDNKTVTTLVDHKVLFKGKELVELIPNDDTNDFIKKFRLNQHDAFIFFIKNEQELSSFPDLTNFKIKFAMWKKASDKTDQNVIYLDESRDNLLNLINKM